jgi:hypothetical protein
MTKKIKQLKQKKKKLKKSKTISEPGKFDTIKVGGFNKYGNPKEKIVCRKCGKEAKILKTERKEEYFQSDGRGQGLQTWRETHLKCSKCNKTGTIKSHYNVHDAGFYSASNPHG